MSIGLTDLLGCETVARQRAYPRHGTQNSLGQQCASGHLDFRFWQIAHCGLTQQQRHSALRCLGSESRYFDASNLTIEVCGRRFLPVRTSE